MTAQKNLTHWLESPNKNYLSHSDLPNGNDIILRIESARQEEVTHPGTRTTQIHKIVYFQEKKFDNGKKIKPFICNLTNAASIIESTGEKFLENCNGKLVKLYVSTTKFGSKQMDCIRLKNLSQEQLEKEYDQTAITKEQLQVLEDMLEKAGKDKIEVCEAMGIQSLASFPARKFDRAVERLEGEINN